MTAESLIALIGAVVGGLLTLTGVWWTTRTDSAVAKANRAAEHANLLRVEVAAILVERQRLRDAQQHLFDMRLLMGQFQGMPPVQPNPQQVIDARQAYAARCTDLSEMAVRTALFTKNTRIVLALDRLRELSTDTRAPQTAAERSTGAEGAAEFAALLRDWEGTYDELESATREVTAKDHS